MGWVTLAADGDDVVRSARTHDGTGGTNGTDVATIPCAASSTSPLASTAEDSHGSRHHAKRRTLRAGADPAGGTRAGAGLRKSRSAQRDPGPGAGAGRGRLAQCEPSATRSTPPRAARAQRDTIRLRWIRASPPRTMRPEVTSPNPLPRGGAQADDAPDPGARPRLPRNGDAQAAPATLMAQSADSPRGGNAQTGAIPHALKRNSTPSKPSHLRAPLSLSSHITARSKPTTKSDLRT